MNKKFVYLIGLLLLIAPVFAATYEEEFITYKDVSSSSIQVEMLKYEPYATNPGEYFTLWFLVYKGGSGKEDVSFELVESYPFSLDSNEDAFRAFSGVPGESILLEYKVRVDEDAVEGDNQITLKYKLGTGVWSQKDFDISVGEAQTEFDGVIQEIEGGSISLALANTGKNVANSVIVKIPSQDGFEAIGTSGQMVGNLDNGDYTIVGFNVKTIDQSGMIKFQIDYTDNIDERRSVILELPLDLESRTSIGELPGSVKMKGEVTDGTDIMTYVWYSIGLFVLILLYVKRNWIKSLISKEDEHIGKPNWMKTSKK